MDVRLEEMKTYQGTNPRPEDFDQFWDNELAQVQVHNSDFKLIKADIQFKDVSCYHLYYKGLDGAKIHAKYMLPQNKQGKRPVIFLFHGYTGSSGDWWEKLSWLHQGYAVVAMDCRGQAGLSEDIGGVTGTTYMGHIVRGLLDDTKQMLYRNIFLDIAVLVKTVKSFTEIDSTNMIAFGNSQGGALSLVCAALDTDIKRVAVQNPFLCDYKKVWQMDCTGTAYEELKLFFRAHDPRHERAEELFTKLGYIDIQNLAPRIKAHVLWGTALQDKACPAITQFAAYNKISSNKRMIIYPDFGHENLPGYMDECFQFLC